jgi:murein DD-endopeptidase MepM/ murein hydrolase activator NlpD
MSFRALAVAALVAVVAGGCARPEPPPRVVSRPDIVLEPDSTVIPGVVPTNATLSALLNTLSLHEADVTGVVEAVGGVFDLRRLHAGQPWRLERTLEGCVRMLEYEIDPERFVTVTPVKGADHLFAAAVAGYDVTRVRAVVDVSIDSETPSLFGAMDAAGEKPDLPMALAAIFGGEIDFNSELQPGDRFRMLVEKVVREGRVVKYGPVLAAEVRNDGRSLTAVRFAPEGQPAGYFDPSGRSLKRFFLRSPLRFEPQITSRFSRARLHPVLRQVRAHLGVDYRAPVGAPVIAVANGVVTRAGWAGGGGRTVAIRHTGGYESYYLHLSRIAVRVGAHVQQGQIIGRVGQSGLATGPHLDYRLKKNGAWVNPVLEHRRMPPGDPVPQDQVAAYAAAREALLQELSASLNDTPASIAKNGDAPDLITAPTVSTR